MSEWQLKYPVLELMLMPWAIYCNSVGASWIPSSSGAIRLTEERPGGLTLQAGRRESWIVLPHFPLLLLVPCRSLCSHYIFPCQDFDWATAVFSSLVAMLHLILLHLHSISAVLYVSPAIFPHYLPLIQLPEILWIHLSFPPMQVPSFAMAQEMDLPTATNVTKTWK